MSNAVPQPEAVTFIRAFISGACDAQDNETRAFYIALARRKIEEARHELKVLEEHVAHLEVEQRRQASVALGRGPS